MRMAVGLTLAALGALLLAPAAPAEASLGSVPVVVSDYVASGQLTARLERLYGPGKAKGTGIEFDQTTKPGPISRVYEWTEDRYVHADSDHPIQLTNYWTVPISIGDRPTGVAAVWINPQSDLPELAQFTASVPLATALANVPADAALVHDAATSAWFAVAGGTANPLVAGRSGVTTATPVEDLRLTRATSAPEAGANDANPGMALAIAVLALLVLVIVITLVLPGRLRRRGSEPDEDLHDPVAAGGHLDGEPAPTPSPSLAAAPEPAVARASRGSSARSGAAAAGQESSAAVPKPRTPVSQKPPVSKPTGTKPPSSRPVASRPAASKPPAPKSAPSEPGSSEPGTSQPGPRKRTPSRPVSSDPAPPSPQRAKPKRTPPADRAEPPATEPPSPGPSSPGPSSPRARAKKPPKDDASPAEG
jgi:hypothetical protein